MYVAMYTPATAPNSGAKKMSSATGLTPPKFMHSS